MPPPARCTAASCALYVYFTFFPVTLPRCTAASCALYVYFIFLPATRAGRIDLQLLKHAVEVYLGLPPSCDITARPRRSV